MATKEKSNKTGTTKLGRKKGGPVGGSPITIGGGGGKKGEKPYIKVEPKEWDFDVINGKLTLRDGGKLTTIELFRATGSTKTPLGGVSKIEILYD